MEGSELTNCSAFLIARVNPGNYFRGGGRVGEERKGGSREACLFLPLSSFLGHVSFVGAAAASGRDVWRFLSRGLT